MVSDALFCLSWLTSLSHNEMMEESKWKRARKWEHPPHPKMGLWAALGSPGYTGQLGGSKNGLKRF